MNLSCPNYTLRRIFLSAKDVPALCPPFPNSGSTASTMANVSGCPAPAMPTYTGGDLPAWRSLSRSYLTIFGQGVRHHDAKPTLRARVISVSCIGFSFPFRYSFRTEPLVSLRRTDRSLHVPKSSLQRRRDWFPYRSSAVTVSRHRQSGRVDD